MAFKKYDETQIGVFPINTRGDHLKITDLHADDGDCRIDIRQMYTGEDGELKFTSKGVRFSRDLMVSVVTGMIGNMSDDEFNAVVDFINSKVEDENLE